MTESFLDGRVILHAGDNREVLRGIADESVDSVVTDPPYALVSIVKRFGAEGAAPARRGKTGAYARASAGFMGKKWDTGETVHAVEFWQECLRVLKPGGHVVSCAGTRTYHRMAVAIEDAGFEIRDMISWTYGSGFPKSHDVAKSLGRELAGPDLREQWKGWGTALKPAVEPICLARKPLIGTVAQNVLQHGTGAINIDGCRVLGESTVRANHGGTGDPTQWRTGNGGDFQSGSDQGRWPANLVHDGSAEVLAALPGTQTGTLTPDMDIKATSGWSGGSQADRVKNSFFANEGSAARFFYTAKAAADDRLGSKHPTVKPVDLMQWLVRLVTPKGGLVLDPFAGTGTTAEAAIREGMRCLLIEREDESLVDIRRRMALVLSGPDERARESIKAKLKDQPIDAGPLFDTIR